MLVRHGRGGVTDAARAGAKVIGVDFREPSEDLYEFYQTDLSNLESITSTLARLHEPIWAAFNCAGISRCYRGCPSGRKS